MGSVKFKRGCHKVPVQSEQPVKKKNVCFLTGIFFWGGDMGVIGLGLKKNTRVTPNSRLFSFIYDLIWV